MNRNTTRSFTANEKEIDKLLKEVGNWKESLSNISEEVHFLQLLLKADVFEENDQKFYHQLEAYHEEIEDLRTENLDLIKEVHNHRYDVEGILECEDISCEVFYHEEHVKLGHKIHEFAERFKKLKLELFSYTGRHLRTSGSRD